MSWVLGVFTIKTHCYQQYSPIKLSNSRCGTFDTRIKHLFNSIHTILGVTKTTNCGLLLNVASNRVLIFMFVVTQRQLMPMYLVLKIIQPREFVFLLVREQSWMQWLVIYSYYYLHVVVPLFYLK